MASVAVAWLIESDWGEWEKLDDQLPDYAQWSVKVGDAIIDVEPKLFKAWCHSGGAALSESTRPIYANGIFLKRDRIAE